MHIPLDLLVTNTLELFKENLGEELLIVLDRNRADPGSVTKGSSRPDFLCWLKDVLVLIGEEKANSEDFETALCDLDNKFNRVDPLIYGEVEFIFCYAAAGAKLRFYAIDGSKDSKNLIPLSEELDITILLDRIVAIQIVINIARIIRTIKKTIVPLGN